MAAYPFTLKPEMPTQIGLIILQADETIEQDFRTLIPAHVNLLVSRIPSGTDVTPETLSAMKGELGKAASLFLVAARFASLGYACTSGAAQIGSERIAELLESATPSAPVMDHITNPVTALVAACIALHVRKVGLLSPYVAEVSNRLRDELAKRGIETPSFGSFDVSEEAKVARINKASIMDAGRKVAAQGGIEALFMSCTNLRTLSVIEQLETEIGIPVLSSNQVLAWHLMKLAGLKPDGPGKLFHT